MSRLRMDAWITGNYGEDHPDNRERFEKCEACGERESIEDLIDSGDDSRFICWECFHNHEMRLCDGCGDCFPLDDMLSDKLPSEARKVKARELRIRIDCETYCEACKCELCENCKGHPDFCRDELCLIPLRSREAMEAARGGSLPQRIQAFCDAEPWRFLPREKRESMSASARRVYLAERCGELCSRFAEYALDELSGFERGIWEAVTKGDYRK